MGSIAEWTVAAMFAHAKVVLLFLFNGKDIRSEISSRMRAVTKGLFGGLAACAESIVFARFKFNWLRAQAGNLR